MGFEEEEGVFETTLLLTLHVIVYLLHVNMAFISGSRYQGATCFVFQCSDLDISLNSAVDHKPSRCK